MESSSFSSTLWTESLNSDGHELHQYQQNKQSPIHVCIIYIYVWKLNQTVFELDFRAVKFVFFPQRDLNPHHWYTAAPFA